MFTLILITLIFNYENGFMDTIKFQVLTVLGIRGTHGW